MQITDPDRLALIEILSKDNAEALNDPSRHPNRYLPGELDRMDRVISWLESSDGPLPREQKAYPCTMCDADPGDACNNGLTQQPTALIEVEPRDTFFHFGRGFEYAICNPGSEWSDYHPDTAPEFCIASVESGPGRTYRGCCLGCDFRGPTVTDENDAVESALDHVWPQWRELPVVPHFPYDASISDTSRWLEAVLPVMPHWWTEAIERAARIGPNSTSKSIGPPIRTHRESIATRSHTGDMPGHGYDASAGDEPEVVSLKKRGKKTDTEVKALASKIATLHCGKKNPKRHRSEEIDEFDGEMIDTDDLDLDELPAAYAQQSAPDLDPVWTPAPRRSKTVSEDQGLLF